MRLAFTLPRPVEECNEHAPAVTGTCSVVVNRGHDGAHRWTPELERSGTSRDRSRPASCVCSTGGSGRRSASAARRDRGRVRTPRGRRSAPRSAGGRSCRAGAAAAQRRRRDVLVRHLRQQVADAVRAGPAACRRRRRPTTATAWCRCSGTSRPWPASSRPSGRGPRGPSGSASSASPGSSMRAWNRRSCSSSLTENQYFTRMMPERISIPSNSGHERRNSSYSSSVQKPITCSTPARLYQDRSNSTISPPDGQVLRRNAGSTTASSPSRSACRAPRRARRAGWCARRSA